MLHTTRDPRVDPRAERRARCAVGPRGTVCDWPLPRVALASRTHISVQEEGNL